MFFNNIAWLVAEKILTAAVLLISNIFVVRYLGPTEYGKVAIFQVVLTLFWATSEFGVRRVLVTLRGSAKPDFIYAQALKIKCFVAIAMTALIILIALIEPNHRYYLLILIYLIFSPLEIYSYYFEASLKNKYLAGIRTGTAVSAAAIRIVLCICDASTLSIAATFLISPVLSALLSERFSPLPKIVALSSSMKGRRARLVTRAIARRGFYFWFSLIIVQCLARVDILSLSWLNGNSAVGLYAAPQKIIEQIISLAAVLSVVALPFISRFKKDEQTIYLRRCYSLVFLLGIIIGIPIFIFAKEVALLLYGKSFAQSWVILAVLGAALPFMLLANMSGIYYSLLRLERFAFRRNLLALILALPLNFVLIKKFDALGAALAAATTQIFLCFLWEILHPSCRKNVFLKVMAIRDVFRPSFYSVEIKAIAHDFVARR